MKYIEIDTGTIECPEAVENIIVTRNDFYNSVMKNKAEVAIILPAYNKLEKTKNCLESIFKYCDDIDYELFLVDNGSNDGTFEYFENAEYANKTIIRITKNLGLPYALQRVFHLCDNRYIVYMGNDIIVTKNAIQNLLSCIKSDVRIGITAAMCSNCSNLQDPQLRFSSLEEMQQQAEKFNKPNPMKWQERTRLLPALACFRKELIDLVGVWDSGFYHEFLEDDFTTRVRRAGFKMMLCGDSFVHHDHQYNATVQDKEKMSKSLNAGRSNFQQKYHGLDAWDDINNFELDLTKNITSPTNLSPTVLGVDVRCGTPILNVRNKLREYGVFHPDCYGFTTQAQYYIDLQSICNDVKCDRIDFIADYYTAENFDYIILGEPINTYSKPLVVLQKLYEFLKQDGTLMFKLRNTADFRTLLYAVGNFKADRDQDMASSIVVDDMNSFLSAIGVKNIKITASPHALDQTSIGAVKHMITSSLQTNNADEALARATTLDYLFFIQK